MPGISATDSAFLAPFFTTQAMREVFSDRARLQAMLDFEAALARAEADAGVIPAEAAEAISAACDADRFDIADLGRKGAVAGTFVAPLSKALTEAAGAAGRFVHWGATTQDVLDTGMVLQVREALALVETDLQRLGDAAAALARRHALTPMAGRTFLQHALPTTLGAKAAGWLDALARHRERLHELRPRVLVLSFGGAAGTLSSLGDRALRVGEALARELGLALPPTPWHAHRDRFAELAGVLGLLAGTAGKIALDVALLMQTEVGEACEPAAPGKGASSAMPHKRNPAGSASVVAAARMAQGLVPVMFGAMFQEHERGIGAWQAEWGTLPQIFALAAGALANVTETVAGLDVDEARMRRNLDLTQGLIFSEAAVMALAPHLGRDRAYAKVRELSERAVASHRHLKDVLGSDAEVAGALDERALERLFDPAHCLGAAGAFVERALAAWREKEKQDVRQQP
jgi:3-carboxy-cis,cis-muconate cycloisomerase